MAEPRVTVVIPAYNVARYVAETIESALAQTYASRDIVVVDDGSTDATAAAVAPYRDRVRFLQRANGGPGAARNAGLRAASGEFVAFLDADDLWAPDTLAVQVEVARRHPDSAMVVCDGVQFDGDRILAERLLAGPIAARVAAEGEVTGRLYPVLVEHSTITCPAQTLIRRAATAAVGWITEDRRQSEDFDFHLRLARDFPVTFHGRRLVRYRYLAGGVSGALAEREFTYTLRRLPVLRRHLRLCRREDRPAVRRALRDRARYQARAAYYRREVDPRFARGYLARLRRLVPADPYVLALLLASWLPERKARARR